MLLVHRRRDRDRNPRRGGAALADFLLRLVVREGDGRGAVLLGVGTAGVLSSLWWTSARLFFAGSVVLSLGWGLTAIGSFRSVVALADPARRAEVVAAVYVVSYLAFSVPSVTAGYDSEATGLQRQLTVGGRRCGAMTSW
jgi:hypothetical protein